MKKKYRLKTHWMWGTKFYHIYQCIKDRCNNIKSRDYKWWWWRGIKCERKTFEEFRDDMYESYLERKSKNIWYRQTSIERKNNDLNYCKENCIRATK